MSIKRCVSSGFTLVEMLIAIVIIGVGVAGVMVAFSSSVKGSADSLVGKQLVAIAEEMMEEILLKPYAETGTAPSHGAAVCGDAAATRNAYDDVRDYAGYQTTGICNIDGQTIAGLEAYNVSVAVDSGYTLNDAGGTHGVAGTLHVTVTATHGGSRMVLDGFRTSY